MIPSFTPLYHYYQYNYQYHQHTTTCSSNINNSYNLFKVVAHSPEPVAHDNSARQQKEYNNPEITKINTKFAVAVPLYFERKLVQGF